MTCAHQLRDLRAAIGPDSGVLCGLCGQDVPTVTVMQRAIEEIRALRAEYEETIDIVARHAGAVRCTTCKTAISEQNAFNGLKKQTVCRPCLQRWFDDEDGDISEMNESDLASYLFRHRCHDESPRLWKAAHEAFPSIGKRIRSLVR